MEQNELNEVTKALRRRITTMRSSCDEMEAMLNALVGERKKIKDTDENGEPTWIYATKVTIPKDFYLTKKLLAYGKEHGFIDEQMAIIFNGAPPGSNSSYEGFIKYYQRNAGNKNGKWSNWSLVAMKWVREQHERKTKQASNGYATKFERSGIRE